MKHDFTHVYTYTVRLKRGDPAFLQAVGYTEQKRAGRIYFHQDADCQDREVFFKTAEIVGITVEGKPVIPGAGRKELEEWGKAIGMLVTNPSKSCAA